MIPRLCLDMARMGLDGKLENNPHVYIAFSHNDARTSARSRLVVASDRP
jgi:hypothetical protein